MLTVHELLAAWVMRFNVGRDGFIDSFSYQRGNGAQMWCELANILFYVCQYSLLYGLHWFRERYINAATIVDIFRLLPLLLL